MEEKNKKILLITTLVLVILLLSGLSYAYFSARGESGVQTVTTGIDIINI